MRRATIDKDTTGDLAQFLSTLSLRRATIVYGFCAAGILISIHALLAESDAGNIVLPDILLISIHALLAESDWPGLLARPFFIDFYPRSPCGERLSVVFLLLGAGVFLSTLSLRRATPNPICIMITIIISIHALLAESDTVSRAAHSRQPQFLSTLSLRRATWPAYLQRQIEFISIHALLAESDRIHHQLPYQTPISIHALLAESDFIGPLIFSVQPHFYPRSPCGERRYLINTYHRIFGISIHALLAESDASVSGISSRTAISIHALLAESDPKLLSVSIFIHAFLSTLSLRRATKVPLLGIK